MLKKRQSIEFHAFELSLGDSVSHVAPNLTELQRWSSALACTKTFITSRFYTTYNHVPVEPYCSLSARSCTACGTRSQTVSEMLVGCSVWLPFTERPSPPKCWLPWRQLQTSALPFMCHCHHLFPPAAWKTTFFPSVQFTDTDTWVEHCATVTGPEPPPKWRRSSIFTIARLVQNN